MSLATEVKDLERAIGGGWGSPELWATVVALAGGVAAVAWPGLAPQVKDVAAAGAALVTSAFGMARQATHRRAVSAATTAVTASASATASAAKDGSP